MSTATPAVVHGSVRGVRTFVLGSGGELCPITAVRTRLPLVRLSSMRGRVVWEPGLNEAVCDRGEPHLAPTPGCTCGFWAFGSLDSLAASGYPESRDVVAVIASHGQLVPGELGFRAQYAHIQAIWMSERISESTRAAVAAHYPHTACYSSVASMLAEHPLTQLATYRTEPAARTPAALVGVAAPVLAWAFAGAVLGVLSLLPLPGGLVEAGLRLTHHWVLTSGQIAVIAGVEAVLAIAAPLLALGEWAAYRAGRSPREQVAG